MYTYLSVFLSEITLVTIPLSFLLSSFLSLFLFPFFLYSIRLSFIPSFLSSAIFFFLPFFLPYFLVFFPFFLYSCPSNALLPLLFLLFLYLRPKQLNLFIQISFIVYVLHKQDIIINHYEHRLKPILTLLHIM